MNRTIMIILIVATALVIFTFFYYRQNPLIPKIKIGDTTFFIEIANSAEEKEKGLGERDILKPGWGMLFPYDHKDKYTFWMKGMNFPLDFVWIADKKVVDLTQNVPILTNGAMTTVTPKEPVDQILELNAGDIQKNSIKVGDPVSYILK